MDNLTWVVIASAIVAVAIGATENGFSKFIGYGAAVVCVVGLYIQVMDWKLGIDAITLWQNHSHQGGAGVPIYLGLCQVTPWSIFVTFILVGTALVAVCSDSGAEGVATLGHVSVFAGALYGLAKVLIVVGWVDPYISQVI